MVMIIAEIGSVHDGSLGNALKLIEAAAECGAYAVKFQTHIADAETLADAPSPSYFRGEPRYEYFMRTAFAAEQWNKIRSHCIENNVLFLSSPFSEEAIDLLEGIGMERYKIPSGEITNIPLIDKVARTGKPVILSSGMSTWSELDDAVAAVRTHHNEITILQCTSEYPCRYEHVGLNIMVDMQKRYHCPIGLSDHTLTPFASFAAVTMGASVIEKHFTFSRRMYGSDARHSMEPAEFASLVEGIRAIEIMLSSKVDKDDVTAYSEMKQIFQKSIVAAVDIPAGERIAASMIAFKKPGTGIPPKEIKSIVGRTARERIFKNSLIKREDLDN